MAWLRLDSNLHTNPKVRRAGPFAACTFSTLLRLVKEHGKQGGRIAACDADPPEIAHFMGVPGDEHVEALIASAIDGLTRRGCLKKDGEDLVIVGWSKYQSDPTAAERQRRKRAADAEDVTDVTDVTRDERDVTESRRRDGTGRDGTDESSSEDSPSSNGTVWAEQVRRVLDGFSRVTGVAYRKNAKGHHAKLTPLLKRLSDEEAGDADAAVKRIGRVVNYKWREWGGDPEMRKNVNPVTLARQFTKWESQADIDGTASGETRPEGLMTYKEFKASQEQCEPCGVSGLCFKHSEVFDDLRRAGVVVHAG